MAITFVAASAVVSDGLASGTAASAVTPALPTGTASGDRVYVCTVGTAAIGTTPTGWTLVATATLGTGTVAASAGTRVVTVFYRDYDGAWTMPAFSQASQATPTLTGAAVTYRKAATEAWGAPTSTSGSDVTVTATAYSATGAATLPVTAGNLLLAVQGNPSNVTVTAGAITATGLTVGTVTERVDGGSATGFDASIHVFDAFPTAGTATAAPVQTSTVSTSGQSSGGTIFVRQAVALLPMAGFVDDFATQDTAKWTWGAAATVSAGQLALTADDTWTGEVHTNAAYDLTGSTFMVELVQRPDANGGLSETWVQLYTNAANANDNAVLFDVKGPDLLMYRNVGTVRTMVGSITYDAVAHRWLRFREAAGTVYWETSPDHATWTTQGSWVTTFAVTALYVSIGTGAGLGTLALFDNVNTAPASTDYTAALADAAAATDAVSVVATQAASPADAAAAADAASIVTTKAVFAADVAAAADGASAAAAMARSAQDAAGALDSVSYVITASASSADAAAATDAVTAAAGRAVSVTDTAAATDAAVITAGQASVASDAAAATDAVTATTAAARTATDVAAAADAASAVVTAAVAVSDTAAAADAVGGSGASARTASDAAAAADAAVPTLTPAGTGFGLDPFGTSPFGGAPATDEATGRSPANITGLLRWSRADDYATVGDGNTFASGSVVDRVNAGTSWAPGTAAAGPTYRAAVAALGNQPGLEFDGTVSDAIVEANTTTALPGTGFTVWAVAVRAATGGGTTPALVSQDQITTNRVMQLGYSSVSPAQGRMVAFVNSTATARTDAGTTLATRTTPAVLTGTAGATASELWSNGASAGATSAAGLYTNAQRIVVGAADSTSTTYPFAGTLAEWGIVDHELTAGERAILHSYVQDRYGIVVADYVAAGTTLSASGADTAAAADAASRVSDAARTGGDVAAAADVATTVTTGAQNAADVAAAVDTATPVLAPPAASLVETFDAQNAEWTGYAADVAVGNGYLSIQPRTVYPRLETTKVRALRGSTFTGELLQLATTSGTSASTSLVFRLDAANFIELSVSPTSATPLGGRFTVAGAANDLYFAAVAGATHYRIEVTTGGQILWRAYASGAWTTFRTATLPAAWGEVLGTMRVTAGFFTGTETTGQPARWGSVNIDPAGGTAYAPTAADAAAAVDAVTTAVTATAAVPDGAAAADAVTATQAGVQTAADTAAAVDAVAAVAAADRIASDVAGATDAVTALVSRVATLADTAGAVDATSTVGTAARDAADVAGAVDAAAASVSPLLETLVDDFATQDAAKWTFTANAAVSGGDLVLTPTTAFPRVTSTGTYQALGSSLCVEFTALPTATTGAPFLIMKIPVDASNSLELNVSQAGVITCRVQTAGVNSDVTYERQVGATHYRIRIAADRSVTFECFAFGGWRPLRRNVAVSAGWNLNAVTVQVLSGYTGSATGVTAARVGSVNVVPTTVDNRKLKFGAAVGGTIRPTTIEGLTAAIGESPSVELIFRAWSLPINVALLDQIHARGALPIYTWEAWDYTGPTNAAYTLAGIVAGEHDDYIHASAQQIKAWGYPLILRPFHEFNGASYPWSVGVNGNTAADVIAAWRHVWDIFAAEGVANVRWFWCPNIRVAAGSVAAGYPGDAYVDIVGVDAYNTGGASWTPAWALFNNSFNEIRSVATGKPMWIGETSSAETGGDKAAWWAADSPNAEAKGLFAWARTVSDLVAFDIFDIDKEDLWSVDSSEASRAAFAAELSELAPDADASDLARTSDGAAVTQGRTATDTAAATDSVTAVVSTARTAADVAGGTDTPTSTVGAARAVGDTAGATDGAAAVQSIAEQVADTAGAVDAATGTLTGAAQYADTAAAVDAGSAQADTTRSVSDVAAGVDAIGAALGTAKAVGDVSAAVDAATTTQAQQSAPADAAGAVDSVDMFFAGAAQLGVSDVAAAGDAASSTQAGQRAVADPAAAIDGVSWVMTRVVVIADAADVADAIATAASVRVGISDIAGAADVMLPGFDLAALIRYDWRLWYGRVGGRLRATTVSGTLRGRD